MKHAFELHSPLGEDNGQASSDAAVFARPPENTPTGKTGVAFGLVLGRKGSEYAIIDKNIDSEGCISFRYYIGRIRRGELKPVLSPLSVKGEWVKLMTVSGELIELYYSLEPAAATGKLPGAKCDTRIIAFEPEDFDQTLFIRIKKSDEIEYVVAPDVAQISEQKIKTLGLK